MSKMLDFLIGEFGVSPEDVHLVGHSLGAHIAGLAGEHMTMGNVSRITGTQTSSNIHMVQEEKEINTS